MYLCRSVTGVKSNDMGYATPPARHKQPRESPALATYNLPRMNKDTRTVQPPKNKTKNSLLIYLIYNSFNFVSKKINHNLTKNMNVANFFPFWKSILLPKLVLTFHCLNKLF